MTRKKRGGYIGVALGVCLRESGADGWVFVRKTDGQRVWMPMNAVIMPKNSTKVYARAFDELARRTVRYQVRRRKCHHA